MAKKSARKRPAKKSAKKRPAKKKPAKKKPARGLSALRGATDFWSWFAGIEDEIASVWRSCNPAQGLVVSDRLREVLAETNARVEEAVGSGVQVEFGPAQGRGKFQLVLTVLGSSAGVPALNALADEAPVLRCWTVVKYRPAMTGAGVTVTWEETELSASDVSCSAEVIEGDLIVILYAPCVRERNGPGSHAAVLLMDALIGEELAVTGIDELLVVPSHEEPAAGIARFPLLALRERLLKLRS